MISKKRKQRITKSKARIKLGSSWLAYVGITAIALSIGFGLGYRLFDGGGATSFLMEIVELDSRNKKLEKAAELIRLSNNPISTVCFDVGFNNTSHFTRLFQSKYKISPKHYRLKHLVK